MPSSVPSLPVDLTASEGIMSGLCLAEYANDPDLPPDMGSDAELSVAGGSAAPSGLSWHGVAKPGSPDVDLPPDTDPDLNAWDDFADEVDEVVGPQGRSWARSHTVPSLAESHSLIAGKEQHDIGVL